MGPVKEQQIISHASDSWYTSQNSAHALLEVLRCRGDAKWELVKTKPLKGCDEGFEEH